jgi:hypothetical protein
MPKEISQIGRRDISKQFVRASVIVHTTVQLFKIAFLADDTCHLDSANQDQTY